MRVNVKLFAILRERAGGTSELVIHLRPGATVADAAESLIEKYPDFASLLPRIAFAVNESYVKRETPLSAGDELALIPPVSGGAADVDDDDSAFASAATSSRAQRGTSESTAFDSEVPRCARDDVGRGSDGAG